MTNWDDELVQRAAEQEYFYEIHGVECAGCGLVPTDIPDEQMMNQGWMNVFERHGTQWFCLGCDPYA